MLSSDMQAVGNGVCVLGECPVWDPVLGRLFWIDSLSQRVYMLDSEGSYRSWHTPDLVGAFALCESGLGLCALRNELRLLDLGTGGFTSFARMPNDPTLSRLNDGKCDRQGRFWIGTLTVQEGSRCGELFLVEPNGTITQALDQFTNSNGLAFPESDSFFFHSDSRVGCVFKITKSDQQFYHRELFHQTDAAVERPDGAALDEHGFYWTALYGGGAVIRVDPNGREVFRLQVPTPYPTMVAFGDEDLRTLFITTAMLGGMAPRTDNDPMAGRLFRVRVQVSGLREPRFSL